MIFSYFTLRKCRNVLKQSLRTYRRRKGRLTAAQVTEFKGAMESLQNAVLQSDATLAKQRLQILEKLRSQFFKKSLFDHLYEMSSALVFALFIAVVIRQTWFEFYEIPSGSMRPTLKEHDLLAVSKTQFGINFPLKASHFLFDQEEVARGGIIIFTGENMDIPDVKTRYFYVFPGTKQYVKRMIGLPGDTLYFYGGEIYGIDKQGKDISSHYHNAHFNTLEHIPFIHLEGKVIASKAAGKGGPLDIFLHQMNIPIAKLSSTSKGELTKQLLSPPKSAPMEKQTRFDLYDLWGMGNYATVRMLTHEQLVDLYRPSSIKKADYYLEFTHHANLEHAKIKEDLLGRTRPIVGSYTSLIPLEEKHLRKLWEHLYTARFDVKNSYAKRYGLDSAYATTYHSFLPKLRGFVPDGTYEYQNGKAYQVKWQGLTKELPESHPLAQFDPDRFYVLFNVGMEFDVRFLPQYFHQTLSPARYAYFKDGELCLLGAPIFTKDDPILQEFVRTELMRAENGQYVPFIDQGAPLKPDGSIDRAKIEKLGLTVPEGHYLVLGDNHAMSADSRDFGFVPKENIRGVPTLIFWASGSRYGYPNQLAYEIFTTPRLIIWSSALLIFSLWSLFHRKRYHLPIDFKKE